MGTLTMKRKPQVVVVGAGFGGLAAVRGLAHAPAQVVLVDRSNYYTFLPLLYQVAATELDAVDITYPVRSYLRRRHGVRFVMGEVSRIDLTNRQVEIDGPPLHYDYLILATGSEPHFFGIEGAERYSFPLYSLEEGLTLRSHILRCFEQVMKEPDTPHRQQLLTFAIVGGGPTGVEFAGALAELVQGPMRKDYPGLEPGEIRIVLLEAMDGLLSSWSPKLRAYTAKRLSRMGVDVRLNSVVTLVTPDAVHLKDGSVLPASTVVWTAGVRASSRLSAWGLPTGRSGRVPVEPTLQVSGHPEVYVVGDAALLQPGGAASPLPMVAAAAVQEGKTAAKNIRRQIDGKELRPFRYLDWGSMVAIGRNAGVARIGILWNWTLTGFPAWVAWLGAHLLTLVGYRNRFVVMLSWAWDYLFFQRAARLIDRRVPPPQAAATEPTVPDQ